MLCHAGTLKATNRFKLSICKHIPIHLLLPCLSLSVSSSFYLTLSAVVCRLSSVRQFAIRLIVYIILYTHSCAIVEWDYTRTIIHRLQSLIYVFSYFCGIFSLLDLCYGIYGFLYTL